MEFKIKRYPNILQRENTALLVIDIQERILKVILQIIFSLDKIKKSVIK